MFKEVFEPPSVGAGSVKGVSAYPGLVRGKAKIVPLDCDPASLEIEDGGVIIAVHTNPDYLPLLKKAVAIVTDEGGILSHAAIISRELRIPCIIGTKDATRIIKNGDEVEVDANRGVVGILKKG